MQNESRSRSRQLDSLLGVSRSIKQLKKNICLYAPLKDESVLIVGETGTGKELVAKAVHEESGRHGGLHPVNCNAFSGSAELIESELFGYKKGAFTDAKKDTPGTLEAAGKGTVFLDEIGDLPLLVQGKLLRAIENGVVRPVGSTKEEKIECRFIAATNKVNHETFNLRPDLFHRFDHHIKTDPLRERREDALTLFLHFADEYCKERGKPVFTEIPFSVAHELLAYDWPGNVRELRRITREWVLRQANKEYDVLQLPLRLDCSYFNEGVYFNSRWLGRGLTLDPMSWALHATINRNTLVKWSSEGAHPMVQWFSGQDHWMKCLLKQALAAEERLLSGKDTFAFQDATNLLNRGKEYWDNVRRLEESKLPSGMTSRASLMTTLKSLMAKTDLDANTTRDAAPESPREFSIGPHETVASVVTKYCKAIADLHKNRTEAAESLGITRSTLRKYLKGAKSTRLR